MQAILPSFTSLTTELTFVGISAHSQLYFKSKQAVDFPALCCSLQRCYMSTRWLPKAGGGGGSIKKNLLWFVRAVSGCTQSKNSTDSAFWAWFHPPYVCHSSEKWWQIDRLQHHRPITEWVCWVSDISIIWVIIFSRIAICIIGSNLVNAEDLQR